MDENKKNDAQSETRANKKPARDSAEKKGAKDDARWVLFDAENLVVGRLASEIARRLRGKGNPSFLPYKDSGEHVIVVNTERLYFTGNKRQNKIYYWHTGYPGGIKSRSVKAMFEQNRSCEILSKAVKGMLPRGVLGRAQLKKLRLYPSSEHQHLAQKPQVIDFAAQNPKNSRR